MKQQMTNNCDQFNICVSAYKDLKSLCASDGLMQFTTNQVAAYYTATVKRKSFFHLKAKNFWISIKPKNEQNKQTVVCVHELTVFRFLFWQKGTAIPTLQSWTK